LVRIRGIRWRDIFHAVPAHVPERMTGQQADSPVHGVQEDVADDNRKLCSSNISRELSLFLILCVLGAQCSFVGGGE
jgi:hypothetical protein